MSIFKVNVLDNKNQCQFLQKRLCIFINYTDKESEVRSFEKVSAPDVNKFPCIIMKRKQLRSYFNRYKYPKSTCQLLVVKKDHANLFSKNSTNSKNSIKKFLLLPDILEGRSESIQAHGGFEIAPEGVGFVPDELAWIHRVVDGVSSSRSAGI